MIGGRNLLMIFLLSVCAIQHSLAADQLTLRVTNSSPTAGSSTVLVVDAPPTLNASGGVVIKCDALNYFIRLKAAPYQAVLAVPSQISGPVNCSAAGFIGDNMVKSNEVTILVGNTLQPLKSLYLQGPAVFVVTENSEPLKIYAYGVTDSNSVISVPFERLQATITPQSIGNANGVALDKAGNLVGKIPGNYNLSITYGALSANASILVRKSPDYLKDGTTTYNSDPPSAASSGTASDSSSRGGGATSHYFLGGLLLAALALPGSRARRPAIAGPKAQCT